MNSNLELPPEEARCSNRGFSLITLLFALLFALSARTQSGPDFAAGEVLVKLRSPERAGAASLASAAPRLLAGATHRATLTADGWQVFRLPEGMSVAEAVTRLRASAEVEWAEPNLRVPLIRPVAGGYSGAAGGSPRRLAKAEGDPISPEDPLFPRMYGLERIGAPAAWDLTRGSTNVVVAVFDTGVDYTHPDLAANMWHNPGEIPDNRIDDDRNGFIDDIHGINVVNGTGDPMDLGGHGTHVAGTIGAIANNAIGVSGINWNVQILAVRVAREYDSAFIGDLVRGLDYLTALKQRGINLVAVNHSWGGLWPSRSLSEAFHRLAASGVVNLCAAGNSREDHRLVPKFPNEYNYPGIITVAASDANDHLADFTDFGIHTVDVAAPGVWIWSTLPGNRYGAWAGTSMATPHVTGAIALLFSVRPDLTPEQARLLLMHTVDPLPAFDRERVLSGGRINVARAVQWLVEGAPLPTSFHRPEVPSLGVTRVSHSPEGYDSNEASSAPTLSADGRWVAFVSAATNLVHGDTTLADIFLHDRQAGTTVRVSETAAGGAADGASSAPAISADARFLAFATASHNLVDGDTNGQLDVLVWDRETKAFDWASRPEPGLTGGGCDLPSISGDGRWVAFQSSSALVAADSNSMTDIYVWDRHTDTLEIVSTAADGGMALRPSTEPSISADGRHVAFVSTAGNLIADDVNRVADIFVRDRETGITTRESVNSSGEASNGGSRRPMISADGRFVAFQSTGRNLDPLASTIVSRLYLRDRESATTRLVGMSAGQALTGTVEGNAISADGRWILFRSDSQQLPPSWGSSLNRLFAYDRMADDVIALAYNDAGEPLNGLPTSFGATGQGVLDAAVSADGRVVALSTTAWNLSPGDGNVVGDVFVQDRGAASLDVAVSHEGAATEIGRGLVGAELPQLLSCRLSTEPGGRFQFRVINRSENNREARVWIERIAVGVVIDWPAEWTAEADGARRLPEMAPGASATFGVFLPAASTESSAQVQVAVGVRDATGGPVIGDRATVLALTDLKAPDTELASWAADGTPSPRHANNPSVDSNGQRVAYDTFTDSIVLTDKNDHNDVFVWDRARWQTGIVGPAGGAAATDWSLDAQISANGRCVAFSSYANNMGPDANYNGDIFVKDLDTGAVQLASRYGAAYGNYSSEWATMCDDRHVAFHSYANNLAIGDANRQCDVFVLDRTTATLSLISCSGDGAPGNGRSWYPRTSASGRFVTFSSEADDLGSNPDTNSFEDAYIWDATTQTVELLSVGLSGAAAQGQTWLTGVSDDGRYVSLMSDASDLPGGLRDGRPHLYLLDRTERVFYPSEHWLAPDTPSAAVNYFTVGDDGEWLALGSQRELGVGDQRLLETRLELVQRTTGRRQTVATGLRGPGASRDGFSEVHGSLAGLLGQRRFLVFQGDGREGREFVQQAYLFDRAQPRVEVQFGRTSDRLRRSTDAESNPLLRELQLLVTPGTPAMFHLVLRNTGEFADTLELAAAQMAAEWQLALQAPPGTETLALPLSFSNLAAQAEVALGAALVLGPGAAPSPVELTLRSTANHAVMEHIRIQPLLDSDADQMADAWELEHFGNLTAATAGTDADNDGQTDRDEFLAGTHPAAVQPPLALSAVALLPDGRLRLEWPAVADRVYLVQRSAALDLPFASRGEPIPGRAGAIEFLDTLDPGTSAAFYRILVELP